MSRRALVSLLHTIELALVGLFFVQALRRLPGLLVHSGALNDGAAMAGQEEASLSATGITGVEILVLLLMLLFPLAAWRHARWRHALPLGAALVAIARALPALWPGFPEIIAAAAVIGCGLAFIALILQRRVMHFPQLMVFGFAADQVVRAAGNTLDISWTAAWNGPQLLLSLVLIAVSVLLARRFQEPVLAEVTAQHGLITAQGAAGIGGLLFLEITLLSLPNAVAARTGTSLQVVTPLLVGATLLPLLSPVRAFARDLLQLFYGGLRGWLWMALIALLLVIGLRLDGLVSALALVLLQFFITLMWWWLLRPQEENDRNLSAVALPGALLVTALLLALDFLTVASPLNALPTPPNGEDASLVERMLLGIRGMGQAILLLAVILTTLPMTRTRQRVTWARDAVNSQVVLLLLPVALLAAVAFTRPHPVAASLESTTLRVATWNIEAAAGRSDAQRLEDMAQTIASSGADLVLLQNVDAGRSGIFQVDQAWWLARRLGMHHGYFPTADGSNGLAVLARARLQESRGWLAVGDGRQGGLQRARFEVEGRELTLYNYWPGQTPRNLQLQIGAMNSLIGALHAREEPALLVLAASLDGAPEDALLLPLRAADFLDPFAELAGPFTWTRLQGEDQVRSDFLWYRTPLADVGTGILEAPGHKHRLVMVELSLTG